MAAHPQGYVGAVRVPDGTVNVAAAVDRQALLHRNPAEVMSEILLACRFPPASDLVLSQVKGTALLTRQSNRLADERLFLVGDAGGYLEPITGEGMAWAFASALAVASLAVAATTQWKPRMEEQWQHAANQVVSRRQTICWSLSRLCRHPWLLDLAMRTVTCVPSLAAACVSQLNKIATESEALC